RSRCLDVARAKNRRTRLTWRVGDETSVAAATPAGPRARIAWFAQSNPALEPTPNSLRSYFAAALGRGSPPAFVAPPLRQHRAEPCATTPTILAQPSGGRPGGTAQTTPKSSGSSVLLLRLATPSHDSSWSKKSPVAFFIGATLRYALRRWM